MDLDIAFDFGVFSETATRGIFVFRAVDVSGDAVALFEGFCYGVSRGDDGAGVVAADGVVISGLREEVDVFLRGEVSWEMEGWGLV